MGVIDPVSRVPSWYLKMSDDERMRQEALLDFERARICADRAASAIRFWQIVSAVLAVSLVVSMLMR